MQKHDQMTLDEAIEKYGNVPLYFYGYYKYCFSFEGETDEVSILAEYGGYADDIYRYDVSPKAPEFLDGSYRVIRITDKNTGEVLFNHINI